MLQPASQPFLRAERNCRRDTGERERRERRSGPSATPSAGPGRGTTRSHAEPLGPNSSAGRQARPHSRRRRERQPRHGHPPRQDPPTGAAVLQRGLGIWPRSPSQRHHRLRRIKAGDVNTSIGQGSEQRPLPQPTSRTCWARNRRISSTVRLSRSNSVLGRSAGTPSRCGRTLRICGLAAGNSYRNQIVICPQVRLPYRLAIPAKMVGIRRRPSTCFATASDRVDLTGGSVTPKS